MRNQRETVFRAPANLPDNSILAILEDREQNIWVGTADGLVRMSAPDVGVLNSRDGLSDDNVSTIYCGPSRQSLAHHRDRPRIPIRQRPGRTRSPAAAGRSPAYSRNLRRSHRRVLVRHRQPGRGALRQREGHAIHHGEGLRNNGIQAFYEDRGQNLWIGTTSGLSRWDGSHFKNYYLEEGLSYGWVRAIAEDHNGDMLVGTDRGLNRFHDGRFVADPAFAALSRDRIWSIYPESPDTLWIGTRGAGLVRVQNGKASRITTQEGLLSNSIFQVIGDGRGRLWMSGPLGLSAASIADLNSAADGKSESVAVLSYGTGDGLESTQINGGVQPSGCVAPDGELWFPSVKGAVHFKPGPSADQLSCAGSRGVGAGGWQGVPATGEVDNWPRQAAGGNRIHRLQSAGAGARRLSLQVGELRRALDRRHGPPGGILRQSASRTISLSRGGPRRIAGRGSRRPASLWWCGRTSIRPPGSMRSRSWPRAPASAGVFLYQERQARERYNLRLAERTRIAREMHDTVVQGCVGRFDADRSGCRLGPLRPGPDAGMPGQRPHSSAADVGRSSPGAHRSAPRFV